VEWQQDKLLALGQARIFCPEVKWPAFLLIQVVEPPSTQEALCYNFDHGAARTDRENQETPQDSVAEVEDFVDSLARREGILNRKSLHQALTNYAIQHAGTDADLDSDLEATATDHLLQQNSEQ